MPLWLERFFIEHPLLVWVPLVVCVGGAAWLWWWQSNRRTHSGAAVVRVGWFGGVGTVVVVVGGIALAGYSIGLWSDVWRFINERPGLIAEWVAATGAAVFVWGGAVHMWRGEKLLARQCRKCGYDMTGVGRLMTCPECGRVAKNEWQLRPRNVRRSALWAGGLLIAFALVTPLALKVGRRGPVAALPSRVLVWWISRASEPPDAVLTESVLRMKSEEREFVALIPGNAEAIARQALQAPVGNLMSYEMLLRHAEVSDDLQHDAVAQMKSRDPIRRLAAVRVLTSVACTIEIDSALLATWTADSDPRVSSIANVLRIVRADWMLGRLTGRLGGKPERDVEKVRTYVRACTNVERFDVVFAVHGVEDLLAHSDREIADRAACLLGASQMMQFDPDPSPLIRMLEARERLDRGAGGKPPQWTSPCYWLRYTQGRGGDTVVPNLIDHPDVSVRVLLFRQLAPEPAIAVRESWAAAIVPWRALLPRLKARLTVEDQADARVGLTRLIAQIEGPVPAGHLP